MDIDGPPTQPEPFTKLVQAPSVLPVFFGPQNMEWGPLLGPEGDPVRLPAASFRDPRKRSATPPSPKRRRGWWWWEYIKNID